MTQERHKEICTEAHRRLNLWLDNSTFEDMTVGFSYLRFDMCLGLNGYPFTNLEHWMNKKDFNKFITDEEFFDPIYDNIICAFFDGLMKHKDEI